MSFSMPDFLLFTLYFCTPGGYVMLTLLKMMMANMTFTYAQLLCFSHFTYPRICLIFNMMLPFHRGVKWLTKSRGKSVIELGSKPDLLTSKSRVLIITLWNLSFISVAKLLSLPFLLSALLSFYYFSFTFLLKHFCPCLVAFIRLNEVK